MNLKTLLEFHDEGFVHPLLIQKRTEKDGGRNPMHEARKARTLLKLVVTLSSVAILLIHRRRWNVISRFPIIRISPRSDLRLRNMRAHFNDRLGKRTSGKEKCP